MAPKAANISYLAPPRMGCPPPPFHGSELLDRRVELSPSFYPPIASLALQIKMPLPGSRDPVTLLPCLQPHRVPWAAGRSRLAIRLHRSRTNSKAQTKPLGPSRTFRPGAVPAL